MIASSSPVRPTIGEANTAAIGMSCLGLSRIFSRFKAVCTSREEKYPVPAAARTGIPNSPKTFTNVSAQLPRERSRITMSEYRSGRRPSGLPCSSSFTSCASIILRISVPTALASSSGAFNSGSLVCVASAPESFPSVLSSSGSMINSLVPNIPGSPSGNAAPGNKAAFSS